MRFRSLAAAVPLLAAVVITGTPASSPAPAAKPVAAAKPAAAANGWTTYHFDNARDGNDTFESPYNTHDAAGDWSRNNLDGSVFASPLAYSGMIFVATENNVVYALNETTGATLWSVTVATPVPDNSTYLASGCAFQFGPNAGITGTPVIDPAAGVIYVVALVLTSTYGHLSEYQLFGIRISDQSIVLHTSLGNAGLDPRYQIQRGALGLFGGRVYVTFGGRPGDCNPYHPWVVTAPTAGGAPTFFQPQSASQGRAGIWSPSGMAIDASGNVYVATGNGSETDCAQPWDYGDGVLKQNPGLSLQPSSTANYWRPANWCGLSGGDTDVGSVAPMLLSNGDIFQSGKSGDGWLLNSANLGGQDGHETTIAIPGCGGVFDGYAYDGARVYVPCDGHGMVALNVDTATHTLSTAWQSAYTTGNYTGNPGGPILAGGLLWVEDQGGGSVRGFDPATGAEQFNLAVGAAHRFTTLAADNGYLIGMLNNGVQAFHMTTFVVNYTAYFPWFDRVSSPSFRDDNIHVINPDPSNPVSLSVSIPGCSPFGGSIAHQSERIFTCATGFGGPVKIEASARVIASQRVRYGSTFSETPAQAATSAAALLYFPWYDLASDPGFIADNIHVINPTGSAVTATVTFPGYGDIVQPIAAGGDGIFNCRGCYGGPVVVRSSGGGLLASQRVQYNGSFNESPAQSPAVAGTSLWGVWFDRISDANFRSDNVHIVNPSGSPASVSVAIPGCPAQPASIPSGGQTFVSCAAGYGGPVHITSNVNVLATSRVEYGQTFNEVAAQALAAAGSPVYFPWFDRVSDPGFLADNVHVVNPNPSGSVTVTVTIPGCGTLPAAPIVAGQEKYFTCATGFGGPVTVTSTGGNVLASQRVRYNQSFNEVAAQP